MKVPLSWLTDFVDITDTPIEDLAHRLTMAGLEVEEIRYVGMPMPEGQLEGRSGGHTRRETKVSGLEWEPEKIVVAEVREVMPHPNADRLVLCRLYDGVQEHIVLTGAPNLFPYLEQGELDPTLKVAYAREGAHLYDGHKPGQVLTKLKRAKIRGVESYSMICSEKELGISEEHEGVIILDQDAPVGEPLVSYMGDAVLDIAITPNIARDANMLGVAREIAALTGKPLRLPDYEVNWQGPSIEGKARIEIREPDRNPRFVLGLVQGVDIGPSPYWAQRRLRLAGMRPINNIVDSTNYVMLEIGEPLHAFDYDVLVERAGGQPPTIITRSAEPGETLVTLDDVERRLDDFTVLVTDTAGPLSIAGVMGGEESEVDEETQNILLEGAAWNFINIRRTLSAQRMSSEAAYRFSRGVHPSMAERGVRRCLELMRQWTGGEVAQGLIDAYPLPPEDPVVEVSVQDVEKWLGIRLSAKEIADLLYRLEFMVEIEGDTVRATTPDHRLDIGQGVIGVADLLEEIARVYGYDRIPETRMADRLPLQRGNRATEREERLRDLLAGMGLVEVVTYRMTSAEREARLLPGAAESDGMPYARMMNPAASDRDVLRHSLLASVMEVVERNAHLRQRIAIFEIGPVFFIEEKGELPQEVTKLAVAITGPRELPTWQDAHTSPLDFYDLKGILEAVFDGMHLEPVHYQPAEHVSFHPGKCGRLVVRPGQLDERVLGYMGELHPQVAEHYEIPETPLIAADLDLAALLDAVQEQYAMEPVPAFPPAIEDLAVIVDEDIPAVRVAEVIRQGGEGMVRAVELFDVYRGEQIGAGKKSLAYRVTYQAEDHTLTEKELVQIRQRVIRRLEQELDAHLRS